MNPKVLCKVGIISPIIRALILNVWRNEDSEKKSESQMGFEPTTLRDLVGCSNHRATGDSVASKGQFVGLDWSRIARLHSQVMASTCETH